MANTTKIQDETELRRWMAEGRSYNWMRDEYARKYNIDVSPSMFANYRARSGLPRRQVRNDRLIPWRVNPEHRYRAPIAMLRLEARRRAGGELTEGESARLDAWLTNLDEQNAVVRYDPDTDQGWFYVARRPERDLDLIYEPDHATTAMPNADER